MASTINLNKPTTFDRTDSLLASAKLRTEPHGHTRPLPVAGNCFLQGGKSASKGVSLEIKDLRPAGSRKQYEAHGGTGMATVKPRIISIYVMASELQRCM